MFLGVEHAPSSSADTMHGVMNFMLIILTGLSDRFDVNGVY